MKIAYIGIENDLIWRMRREMLASLVHNRCDVTLIVPDGPKTEALKSLGLEIIAIPASRHHRPLEDFFFIFRLYRVLRKIKPDIVYTSTVKPNTYGTIAARWAGVPKIVSGVAGVGRSFDPPCSFKERIVHAIVFRLYRRAGRYVDKMWFQNRDDLELFCRRKIVPREKCLLIRSSGVNTNDFSPENIDQEAITRLRNEFYSSRLENPEAGYGNPASQGSYVRPKAAAHTGCGIKLEDAIVITMLSRVDVPKGVAEFIEASRIARNWQKNVFFLLAGERDEFGQNAISDKQLEQTETFRYVGKRTDVRNILAVSDIVTLPSYHEGVPRSLLEGMAMGKPIVTTDAPGCRETVEDGVNGFLVPVKNPELLARALYELVIDREKREAFGKAGMLKVFGEFSCKIVHKRVLEELFGIENPMIPDIKTRPDNNGIDLI